MSWVSLATIGLFSNVFRSALALLSLVATFALFGVLQGALDNFRVAISGLEQSTDRLRITSRISQTDPLPMSHLARIASIDGVAAVVPSSYLLAYYQDRANWVGGFAIDAQSEFEVFKEFRVSHQAVEHMSRLRNGAVVGKRLADQHGWKVGDVVPLISQVHQTQDGTTHWEFEIVGLYEADNPRDARAFLVNHAYFDEHRQSGKGSVASFWVTVSNPSEVQNVARRIDAAFANSADETLSQSVADLAYSRIRQLGNVDLMVRSVVGAALLMAFFVVGNTVRQSVHQRIPEFAVLRALGFVDRQLACLVIVEVAILSVLGAGIGIAISSVVLAIVPADFGVFVMRTSTIVSAALLALVFAVACALVPTLYVHRMSVVAALRR